jgi:hypothetical protein
MRVRLMGEHAVRVQPKPIAPFRRNAATLWAFRPEFQ